MNIRPVALAFSISIVLLGAAGCKTAASSGAPAPSALAGAYGAWKAGDAAEAFAQGKAVADNLKYPLQTRQEAAYVAGMAARKLNRRHEAAVLLGQAAGSADAGLRGPALAELGMTRNELTEFKEGAKALLQATDLLTGEQRALAYYQAGIAEQKLDYWSDARIHLILAMKYTTDAALKEDIQRQINVTGYTLQVGSFMDIQNAQRVAAEWKAKTDALRLAAPRVIKAKNAANIEVFLVQVGAFSTFDSARQYQGRLGASGGVVAPLWGK